MSHKKSTLTYLDKAWLWPLTYKDNTTKGLNSFIANKLILHIHIIRSFKF